MMWVLNAGRGLGSCLAFVLLAIALLVFSGCSFKSSDRFIFETPSSWLVHLASLKRLNDWSFNGRVAVRQKDESWSVKLRWAQSVDRYDIHIAAPFGQGAAHLYGDAQQATIVLPNQSPLFADSAEALLQSQVGWAVPVDGMRYWLLGRPGPMTIELMVWDEQGRLAQLEQAGWRINYRRYKEVRGVVLPSKIEIMNDDLRIKLIVDGWQL